MANDHTATPLDEIVWDVRDIERLRQQLIVIDEFRHRIRNGDFASLEQLCLCLDHEAKHFCGILRRTVDRMNAEVEKEVSRLTRIDPWVS